MELEKFNRKYRVRIDTSNNHIQQETSPSEVEQSSSGGGLKEGGIDFLSLPSTTEVIEIKDLHMEATVVSSKNTKVVPSSPAKINIYNLPKSDRNKIKADAVIILEAGFDSDEELKTIYAGQVVSISTGRQPPDVVTTLVCDGTFSVRKNLRVAKSWPEGVTYRQIIQYLLDEAGKYGLSTEFITTLPQNETTNKPNGLSERTDVALKGYAIDGFLLEELTSVCNETGLRCYFSKGALSVEPVEYSERLNVYQVGEENIKGNIYPYSDNSKKLSGSSANKNGYTITLPLDGGVSLTDKVELTTQEVSGLCDIETISYHLSYYGDVWDTELRLIEI